MPSLGGHVWVCRGILFDYCFLESIESLLGVCDEVAVTFFSDNDWAAFQEKFSGEKRIKSFKLDESRFDEGKGPERLAMWTNFTKDMLSTEWQFCLQADEIIHEATYPAIREAMERKDVEAFIVRRFNLWGDPYHYLNYPKLTREGRFGELPCSEHTGRLAKIKYKSWNDAESLDAPFNHDYMEAIRTYHMGFVRDKKKMVQAKIHMQEKIFNLMKDGEPHHDVRFDEDLKQGGNFRPEARFSKDDLLPIYEELPKVIQNWAKERA